MSSPSDGLSLSLTRHLKSPRHKLWQAFADPGRLAQWWCPKPWVTEVRAFDFRPGGAFHTIMRGPECGISDNPGSFLAIEPPDCFALARIVSTSLLRADWQPAPAPGMPMTAIWTFADEAGGTRYTATALHADRQACEEHANMGFEVGWGICADQLDAFAQTL
jgi:uncharacterized protein YndB with AHSA1/START domain